MIKKNLFQRNKQGDIAPGNVVLKQWVLSVMQKTATQFFQSNIEYQLKPSGKKVFPFVMEESIPPPSGKKVFPFLKRHKKSFLLPENLKPKNLEPKNLNTNKSAEAEYENIIQNGNHWASGTCAIVTR